MEKIPDCSLGSVRAMPSRTLAAIDGAVVGEDGGGVVQVAAVQPGGQLGHVGAGEGGGVQERGQEGLGPFDPVAVVAVPFRVGGGGQGVGPGDGLVPVAGSRRWATSAARSHRAGSGWWRWGPTASTVPRRSRWPMVAARTSALVEVTTAAPGWVARAGTMSRRVFPERGGPMTRAWCSGPEYTGPPGTGAEVDPRPAAGARGPVWGPVGRPRIRSITAGRRERCWWWS